MASKILINNIANDNIINYTEYSTNLQITGTVEEIVVGSTIYLELDNKTISTFVDPGLAYTFTIPKNYTVDSNELYLNELIDKTSYIIRVYTETPAVEELTSIYVDLAVSVMGMNDFLDGKDDYYGLVQNGDEIDATNVNSGPIQNRKDIIFLDSKIGDVDGIIDQKLETYAHDADNDLDNSNSTISNAISQLRVDVGNKGLLYTQDKTNLVNAINEIKSNMYRAENGLNLVARYDYAANGNYIASGGNVTYVGTIPTAELPAENLRSENTKYSVVRIGGDGKITTENSTKHMVFTVEPSMFLING